jgi:hypothetical protein
VVTTVTTVINWRDLWSEVVHTPRNEHQRALALIRKDSITEQSVMAPGSLLRTFDRKSRVGLSL